MTLTTKTIEKRIKKEYPKGIDLIYIDYRDSFDENKEIIEELAQTGSVDSVEIDWMNDSQFESMNEIEKQIFNEKEIEEIREKDELSQAVSDVFYSIDTSTPVKDLLHNTNRRYFYYDLNFNVEAGFYNDGMWDHEKERWPEKTARSIAKKLRVNYNKHKKELDLLVGQASYGGQLVILFVAEPERFFGNRKVKYIKFKENYSICIMDRMQGSGDHTELKIKSLVLEFKRENLHDDIGSAGYSYSNEVCGLCKGDNADFEWLDKLNKTDKLIEVQTNKEAEEFEKREAKYKKTYKEGKCTLGDIKYSRHRDTEYINEYPCGNKCKACRQFWVD
jgi:DNA-binding transcriptional regulator YiaG